MIHPSIQSDIKRTGVMYGYTWIKMEHHRRTIGRFDRWAHGRERGSDISGLSEARSLRKFWCKLPKQRDSRLATICFADYVFAKMARRGRR